MRELERDLPDAAPSPAPLGLPRIAIVGGGRMGRSLARRAAAAGLRFRLAGRDDALEACRQSELALLCVPDDELAGAASVVADAVGPLRLVGHVSGATGLGALEAAAARGAMLFSLHPLQTAPDGETDLLGAPCAIAADSADALAIARRLGEALGLRPFELQEEARAAYHAAASMASNFLVTLEECAADLLSAAGVDGARQVLSPLVLRTAANWAERGPGALTGPIARGDTATVERHLAALRETAPDLVPLYEALAARTRALAEVRA